MCLWALVVAVAGTLGSSRFALFEALQNADYVLTTCGAAPPGPVPLGIGAVAGTLSKRGGTQIEGQVEQQQPRYHAAAHLQLADLDSESVQAAIQRLFDASIMQGDTMFRDFVGALGKLSLEVVRVALASVLVLALGRVCWMWRRIMGSIFRRRRCVNIHLPLYTPIESMDRTATR